MTFYSLDVCDRIVGTLKVGKSLDRSFWRKLVDNYGYLIPACFGLAQISHLSGYESSQIVDIVHRSLWNLTDDLGIDGVTDNSPIIVWEKDEILSHSRITSTDYIEAKIAATGREPSDDVLSDYPDVKYRPVWIRNQLPAIEDPWDEIDF